MVNESIYRKSMMPLLILEILKSRTDENHKLKASEIVKFLEKEYELKADRRTVSTHLNELRNIGYINCSETEHDDMDASSYTYGWWTKPQLKESELRVLIDSVLAMPYIPKDNKSNLLRILKSFGSENFNRSISVVVNENKLENVEFFKNLNMIEEALKKQYSISFNYTEFNYLKSRTSMKDENGKIKKFIIDPYKIVNQMGYFYVISYSDEKISNFRIDLITNLVIKSPFDKDYKIDLSNYVLENPEMTSRELINTNFQIEKEMIDEVLKTFPSNPQLKKIDNSEIINVYLKSNINTIKKFALSYADKVEIISPKKLLYEIKETINILTEKYTPIFEELAEELSYTEVNSEKNKSSSGMMMDFGHSVHCIESLSCSSINEYTNIIALMSTIYISMIEYYLENYEMFAVFEDIFSFKFKLQINDDKIYTEYDFDEVINQLENLKNQDNFSIELRYAGYVEECIDIEQELPKRYFGEFGSANSDICDLLNYRLKDVFKFKQTFNSSYSNNGTYCSFDENGIINSKTIEQVFLK